MILLNESEDSSLIHLRARPSGAAMVNLSANGIPVKQMHVDRNCEQSIQPTRAERANRLLYTPSASLGHPLS